MKTPWQYAETGNEHSHQVALFVWANMAAQFGLTASKWPDYYTRKGMAKQSLEYLNDAISELKWLHAIKNAGHGDAIRGARSAAEGVKAGVPDIFLPVPQSQLHGLYIELKRPKAIGKAKGVASGTQEKWHGHLKDAGYAVEVCYGWEEAREAI
jgi:hypothetical protein